MEKGKATMFDNDDDDLLFVDEQSEHQQSDSKPWKVLIVDDEEEIHRVTQLSLGNMVVHSRPIELLHAYTGRESVEIMRDQPDIALVLMDVVMEDEHAGLKAVERIRDELENHDVRLILRTGQPGQAPEQEVVTRYDINDYKEKTELTTKKMHTLMHTSLNHYRELMALKQNRLGLEKVIDASASIFESQSLNHFARGVLTQLAALLYASHEAVIVKGLAAGASDDVFSDNDPAHLIVTATSGEDRDVEGQAIENVLSAEAVGHIRSAMKNGKPCFGDGYFAAHFPSRSGHQSVIYLCSDEPFSSADRSLIELFCRNVGIAFENQVMYREIVESQRKLVMTLSATVEERSKELHNHVRRVAEYASILGQGLGLNEHELELLRMSAAMHDIGKIAIPDSILNKPGRLSDEERAEMETHVERGVAILSEQNGELLTTAGLTVGSHHERWDGDGYPNQVAGADIPLFGRITALTDVFDALSTDRVYKKAWPMDEVLAYISDQSGKQFDPALVVIFEQRIDEILAVHERWYVRDRGVAA